MDTVRRNTFKTNREAFTYTSNMCEQIINKSKCEIPDLLNLLETYKKHSTDIVDKWPVNFPAITANTKDNEKSAVNITGRNLVDLTSIEIICLLETVLKRNEKVIAKYTALLDKMYLYGISSSAFTELRDEFRIEIVSEGDE